MTKQIPKKISKQISKQISKPKNRLQNYSSNICKLSNKKIKTLTNPTTYSKYKKYISTITNNFIILQKLLLNQIFKTKNDNKDTISKITFKDIILDDKTKIPPFIDIFKYLLTKSEFINNFSVEEQKLLQDNLMQNNTNHTTHTTHTTKSCYNFLDKSNLGNKLLKYYNLISSELNLEINTKYPSTIFHKLLVNSFTSFKIIEDLELNIKKLISFSVVWNGKQFDNLVYMFMYENSFKNHKTLEKIGTEIIKRILFFNDFLNIDIVPNKFIIFLTDNKKEIDDNVITHMHFKTININTAVTNGQDIIIYREQELLKSIFHELIHFHNLDFRQIPTNIIEYLIKTHNIKSDNKYLLYECVTETLANILNNIFISSNIKEFSINLQNEILFSTLQVAKLLNICKYKFWDEFARIDNINSLQTSNPKKYFIQDSCVMSYYILKFYIMINLDTYFKTCLDTKLKFIQNTTSFNNLIHIFDLARKNLVLKTIMDNLLKNSRISNDNGFGNGFGNSISNHKITKKKLKSKINKTLRMTCLESKLFHKNSI